MNSPDAPDIPPSSPTDPATWRILDAALNRSSEGLRVIEDYTRMVLNDAHLTSRLKQLRHDLTAATSAFDPNQLIAQRDSLGDVGSGISTTTEYQRAEPGSVVQANLARLQQSLRTIEEYSKLIAPDVARAVEQLRYRSYTLEKALVTARLSHQLLRSAGLCVLLDGRADPESFRALAASLIAAGTDLLQLRDKALSDRELMERGMILTGLCQGTACRWIMNDRADIAVGAGAHGVHLGQSDLPVNAARLIVGPARIIGVSTHSVDQARAAVMDGANYIGMGPVFPGQTKSFGSYPGLDLIRQITGEISLPAFAIGGIDSGNIAEVLQAGAERVAVSGAVLRAPDPAAAAAHLKSILVARKRAAAT